MRKEERKDKKKGKREKAEVEKSYVQKSYIYSGIATASNELQEKQLNISETK